MGRRGQNSHAGERRCRWGVKRLGKYSGRHAKDGCVSVRRNKKVVGGIRPSRRLGKYTERLSKGECVIEGRNKKSGGEDKLRRLHVQATMENDVTRARNTL